MNEVNKKIRVLFKKITISIVVTYSVFVFIVAMFLIAFGDNPKECIQKRSYKNYETVYVQKEFGCIDIPMLAPVYPTDDSTRQPYRPFLATNVVAGISSTSTSAQIT